MADSPTHRQLLTESIVFWTIALVLLCGRLWSRLIARKALENKLQTDDYFMLATFCCYTSLLILILVSHSYGTNEMDAATERWVLQFPEIIGRRIYGSKIVVASNQCYLATIWGTKACLLFVYYQMTQRTSYNLFVKIVIAYTGLGLVASEVTLPIACQPFSQYWALPVSNKQCANYLIYCIIQLFFNITSDLAMLAVPIRYLRKANLPRAKKGLLLGIFSLGIFVILAACLNKYYNFTMPNTTVYMVWHIREASTSVMVANLMCWWPLMRKLFRLQDDLTRSGSRSRASTAASRGESDGTRFIEVQRTVDIDMESVTQSEASLQPQCDDFADKHSVRSGRNGSSNVECVARPPPTATGQQKEYWPLK